MTGEAADQAAAPAGDPPIAGGDGQSSAAAVIAALRSREETLAVAESLTGGALAATIVDVPGASHAFRGGLVVYAVDLKVRLAGVPGRLLEERGPVDRDVAAALAEGVRLRCDATWGLATTGVAGPEAHGGKPPGTVWLGVAGPNGTTTRQLHLDGDRAAVRAGAVIGALRLLGDALQL
jgi:nicotinamide-nucleotide amidase